MKATVYSDGSFKKGVKRRGGYAYTLITDIHKTVESGEIPASAQYNTHHYCEMFALVAGIHHATRIPGVKSIVALTDSKTCIRFFYSYPPKCQDRLMVLSQLAISETRNLGIRLTVRFVKGHQNSTSKNAKMNNLVDKLAKKSIRDHRV